VLRQQQPRGIERTYLRDILRLLRPAQELVQQLLIERMPEIEAEALQSFDSNRLDTYVDTIERSMGDARLRYGQIVTELETTNTVSGAGGHLNLFNRNQNARQFKRLLGIDVFALDPDLTASIQAFTRDNVAMIESIPSQYFREIENTALRNLRAGRRFSEWKGELFNRYDVSRSRAALIARDQTNKFNGQLNRARQQNLGIDDYTWRTSEDERVREEHEALNGRVFSYTDPKRQPPEGHPGEPIQCRCQAEPNVEAALERMGV
jgi:SPP1 gp7 family putative phage head morphogenesis protein